MIWIGKEGVGSIDNEGVGAVEEKLYVQGRIYIRHISDLMTILQVFSNVQHYHQC